MAWFRISSATRAAPGRAAHHRATAIARARNRLQQLPLALEVDLDEVAGVVGDLVRSPAGTYPVSDLELTYQRAGVSVLEDVSLEVGVSSMACVPGVRTFVTSAIPNCVTYD